MVRYFLDTSALIKRYVRDEPGHQWIAEMCATESGHTIIVAEIALVEVVATFCRMARESPPRLQMAEARRSSPSSESRTCPEVMP